MHNRRLVDLTRFFKIKIGIFYPEICAQQGTAAQKSYLGRIVMNSDDLNFSLHKLIIADLLRNAEKPK